METWVLSTSAAEEIGNCVGHLVEVHEFKQIRIESGAVMMLSTACLPVSVKAFDLRLAKSRRKEMLSRPKMDWFQERLQS